MITPLRCATSVIVIFLLITLPSHAQLLSAETDNTGGKTPSSVVLTTASDSKTAWHLIAPEDLRSAPIRPSYILDRPDSELPTTMRYVLGGALAAVSTASLGGGIRLGIATVNAFRSNARLTDTLGVVTAILSAGAIGFSITSGVWSVRLFRGKAILRGPSR
jgi:hypothetical protein